MSIEHIQQVIDLPPEVVTTSERMLLIALANHADANGRCWPSTSTLEQETSLTKRGILKIRASLEQKGLIKTEKRYKSGTQMALSILFTLTLEGQLEAATGGEPSSPQVVNPVPEVVNPVHHVVNPVHHPYRTVNEPSVDPREDSAVSGGPPDVGTADAIEIAVQNFIDRWNSDATTLGLPAIRDIPGSQTVKQVKKKLRRNLRENPLFRDSVDAIFAALPAADWLLETWKPGLAEFLGNDKNHVPHWEKLLDGRSYRTKTPPRGGNSPPQPKHFKEASKFSKRQADAISGKDDRCKTLMTAPI